MTTHTHTPDHALPGLSSAGDAAAGSSSRSTHSRETLRYGALGREEPQPLASDPSLSPVALGGGVAAGPHSPAGGGGAALGGDPCGEAGHESGDGGAGVGGLQPEDGQASGAEVGAGVGLGVLRSPGGNMHSIAKAFGPVLRSCRDMGGLIGRTAPDIHRKARECSAALDSDDAAQSWWHTALAALCWCMAVLTFIAIVWGFWELAHAATSGPWDGPTVAGPAETGTHTSGGDRE